MNLNNILDTEHLFKDTRSNISNLNIIDEDWIKSSFMISDNDLEDVDARNRYWTEANTKFTDTTLGGHIAINPLPQFTRTCDMRVKGRRSDRDKPTVDTKGNFGMGRYYSEAIDDNAQILYLEFGVPHFNNSLFSFYSRAVDNKQAIMANTGRAPYAYLAGEIFGTTVGLVAFGFIGLAIYGAIFLAKTFLGNSSGAYYELKRTPVLYNDSVNSIMLQITTELGLTIPTLMDNTDGKIGVPVKLNQHNVDELKELLPDLVSDNNYIDVYAIANRGQTIVNEQLKREALLIKKDGSVNDYLGYVKSEFTHPKVDTLDMLKGRLGKIKEVFGYEDPNDKPEIKPNEEEDADERNKDGTYKDTRTEKEKKTSKGFLDYFEATTQGGARYVAFNVKYLGPVTETFSNTTKDIPAGEFLKSISRKGVDFRFNVAGGNIAGEAMTEIQNSVKEFVSGALDKMTFGLAGMAQALMGGAYIDMPLMWDDSTVDLPKFNYELMTHNPYGHPISQIQRIYLPISMILAGVLPLSTGKSSYTSPLLCSAFLRGYTNIALGMITNLTIERGVNNLGWNGKGRALGYKITFTITDFSKIMTAPVNSGVGGAFFNSLDDDNLLDRYIGTITGRSLHNNKYVSARGLLRFNKLAMEKERMTSGAYWGMRAGDSPIGDLVSLFMKDNSIEHLQS